MARSRRTIETRPQVLPTETLLDIAKCLDRRSLDDVALVSSRWMPLPEACQQLRDVIDVFFDYTDDGYVYSAKFVEEYRRSRDDSRPSWRRRYMEKRKMRFGLKFKDQSRRKATGFFVNALRHCRITEQLSFGGVEIDRYFVQQLKAVASDYTFESNSLVLENVSLTLTVDPLELLDAFPSLHELSFSAGEWLSRHVDLDKSKLEFLLGRGIVSLSPMYRYHRYNCSGLSEQALLRYAFGWSSDTTSVRRLYGVDPHLSNTFLEKLVQARRDSRCVHPVHLSLFTNQSQQIDNLRQFADDDDEWYWCFSFPDIPNFRVTYRVNAWRRYYGRRFKYELYCRSDDPDDE